MPRNLGFIFSVMRTLSVRRLLSRGAMLSALVIDIKFYNQHGRKLVHSIMFEKLGTRRLETQVWNFDH